jgi:hypothetical protein
MALKKTSRTHRERLQGDLVAEALELPDKAAGVGLGVVAAQEVVGAEFGVGTAALQHVVGDDEDGMRDGADGLLVAATAFDPGVLAGEGGPLTAGDGVRGLDERDGQPLRPLARPARAALARGLMVAGAPPAQEARCCAVGKRVISGPISARMTSAAR